MTIQGFPSDKITELLEDVKGRIHRIQLLWMPHAESLEVLGESAKHFCDGDEDEYDGYALLAPADAFDHDQIAAALEAGGELLWGYKCDYPQRVIRPFDMRLVDWCGDARRGVAYALWFDVAVVVCALAQGKSVRWL